MINIYSDLEKGKEYTKEELETVWKKRNAELEYNNKVDYSFDVTLDNLIKVGFLINNKQGKTSFSFL